jgi:hypothetical protein
MIPDVQISRIRLCAWNGEDQTPNITATSAYDAVDGSHRRHRDVPNCGCSIETAKMGAVL